MDEQKTIFVRYGQSNLLLQGTPDQIGDWAKRAVRSFADVADGGDLTITFFSPQFGKALDVSEWSD